MMKNMVEQEKQMRLLTTAREEIPLLRSISNETLLPLIKTLLEEISFFQKTAELPIPPTALERLRFIWCFSGPGTYHAPTKIDTYTKYSWARNMDRSRLQRAATIMRKAAEVKLGRKFSPNTPAEVFTTAMRQHAPHLFYNGMPEENAAVRKVLADMDTAIPAENVHVFDIQKPLGKIVRTIDQIREFTLPPDLSFRRGDQFGIISHAPHLPRILRMINQYRPIPEGFEVVLFPVPVIPSGFQEYTELEVKGTLRYIFDFHQATVEPYPYTFSKAADC